MVEPIPFEVPAKYAGDMAVGKLVRVGALLKNAKSGEIVAHLQETGLVQDLLVKSACAPCSSVMSLANTPLGIVNVIQNEQIKSMLKTLQIFQFVDIGATVAGIGVSAIGFRLMTEKLNSLKSKLDKLENRIEINFQNIRQDQLREHYSNIYNLTKQLNSEYSDKYKTANWLETARAFAKESSYFYYELMKLINHEVFDEELFLTFISLYGLCNSGHIECLLLARELHQALKVSQDLAGEYNKILDPLSPVKLVHKSEKFISNSHEKVLIEELESMRKLVCGLREVQDAATSKVYLMETLIERGIDSYEYVKAITDEKDRAILLIEPA